MEPEEETEIEQPTEDYDSGDMAKPRRGHKIPYEGKFKKTEFVSETPMRILRLCKKVLYYSRSLPQALEAALPHEVIDTIEDPEELLLENSVDLLLKC